MESKKKHKKETVGKPIHPHPSTLTTTLTGKPQINNYSFSQAGPIPDYKMITDNQLAFIANSLGVMTMLLIVVYHYVSINDVKRK
ncbi:Oligosaccaryltransferase-domain-containing protein [Phycomyces blakesleeanus]